MENGLHFLTPNFFNPGLNSAIYPTVYMQGQAVFIII